VVLLCFKLFHRSFISISCDLRNFHIEPGKEMEELDRHSVALAQNLEHFDIYRRRRCKQKPTRFFWQNETRFFQTCGHRSFPWIQSFASGWGVERLQERFLMAFHQSFWADLPRLWHSGSIFSTLPTSSGTFHLGKHMWGGPKSLRSKLTLLWMWFTNGHTDIATCAVNLWSVYGCIWCVWTTMKFAYCAYNWT